MGRKDLQQTSGSGGYLAPEYAMRGQLTKKADIYSFGVLVLEIISGRSNTKSTFPVEEQFLLEWTWQLREDSRLLDIVDPRLEEYPKEEVLRFIKVALLCTQAASNFRPSMSQVVAMLSKEININENLLSRPGFISDFKNMKVGAGTNRHAAGTNSHAFQNPQVTALHKAVSSDSNSTVDSTSIVSRSPDTITQLEPRNSESGVHLMDGVIGTRKVNCLKPNYVTFSVAVVSVSTAAMPTERESRGNEELRDRPLDKET